MNIESSTKKYIKKYGGFFFALSEVWIALLVVSLLVVFGGMHRDLFTDWFLAAITLLLILLSTYVGYVFWTYRKASAWWFFYTIFLYLIALSTIQLLLTANEEGTSIALSVVLLIFSFIPVVFATMILLGKEYVSRGFWKVMFFVTLALIPLEIYDTYRVSTIEISLTLLLVLAAPIYLILLGPFYYRLYQYVWERR